MSGRFFSLMTCISMSNERSFLYFTKMLRPPPLFFFWQKSLRWQPLPAVQGLCFQSECPERFQGSPCRGLGKCWLTLEAITQHFPSNCRKSLTYGQLAAFKVNTEKSSIGFIQCFLKNRSYARLRKIKKNRNHRLLWKLKNSAWI